MKLTTLDMYKMFANPFSFRLLLLYLINNINKIYSLKLRLFNPHN